MPEGKDERCHKPTFHPIVSCHGLSILIHEALWNFLRGSAHLLPKRSNPRAHSTTRPMNNRAFNHSHSKDLKKLGYTHYTFQRNSFVYPLSPYLHATWNDCSKAHQCCTSAQFAVTPAQDAYCTKDKIAYQDLISSHTCSLCDLLECHRSSSGFWLVLYCRGSSPSAVVLRLLAIWARSLPMQTTGMRNTKDTETYNLKPKPNSGVFDKPK